MKTKIHNILLLLFAGLLFASCDVNNEDSPTEPTIDGVEIGSGNNGQGIIGRDFHFDMNVVAGDLIESVQVKIEQRSDETYSSEWSFEITWDEYEGMKNTNVHKHFNIPEEAPEGHYDFLIIVNDQNGTQLEEVRTINIYLPENLPVDPQLSIFNITKNGDFIYRNGEFRGEPQFLKNDTLTSQVGISGVKGDGIMYILLIKKSLGYRPESVDDIDFNKATVYDVFEHENEEEVDTFTNVVIEIDPETLDVIIVRESPDLTIGANTDNNTPANFLDGDKAWVNGEYYFGVVYTNTTHDISFYNYVEFEIEGF